MIVYVGINKVKTVCNQVPKRIAGVFLLEHNFPFGDLTLLFGL